MRQHTSRPSSVPGIIMSSSTISGLLRWATAQASSAVGTSMTS